MYQFIKGKAFSVLCVRFSPCRYLLTTVPIMLTVKVYLGALYLHMYFNRNRAESTIMPH